MLGYSYWLIKKFIVLNEIYRNQHALTLGSQSIRWWLNFSKNYSMLPKYSISVTFPIFSPREVISLILDQHLSAMKREATQTDSSNFLIHRKNFISKRFKSKFILYLHLEKFQSSWSNLRVVFILKRIILTALEKLHIKKKTLISSNSSLINQALLFAPSRLLVFRILSLLVRLFVHSS